MRRRKVGYRPKVVLVWVADKMCRCARHDRFGAAPGRSREPQAGYLVEQPTRAITYGQRLADGKRTKRFECNPAFGRPGDYRANQVMLTVEPFERHGRWK